MEDATQRYLQTKQAELQIKLQTDGFDHEETMAKVNEQTAIAKAATMDVDRQKQLMQYQEKIRYSEMAVQNSYDVAMEDRTISQSLYNRTISKTQTRCGTRE